MVQHDYAAISVLRISAPELLPKLWYGERKKHNCAAISVLRISAPELQPKLWHGERGVTGQCDLYSET